MACQEVHEKRHVKVTEVVRHGPLGLGKTEVIPTREVDFTTAIHGIRPTGNPELIVSVSPGNQDSESRYDIYHAKWREYITEDRTSMENHSATIRLPRGNRMRLDVNLG